MFSFCKMQGTGNDFVVVNGIENKFEYSLPVLAKFLCDRHYGVGGDGMILLENSEIADFKMRIFNQDGTEALMCGNGIRCLAKYVFEKGLIERQEFEIETLSGIKKIKLELENKKVMAVHIDMGKPKIDDLKYIIEIDEIQFKVYPVSIGNPHAVCFVKDVDKINVAKIGNYIENYKYFPEKTNVEFVQIVDQENIKVRVWERGVGETNSCGTGACASSIVAIEQKYVKDCVKVSLRGGNLEVNYDKKSDRIELTGPAEIVFEGTIEMM